jgi:hypothetical protein
MAETAHILDEAETRVKWGGVCAINVTADKGAMMCLKT